MKTLTVIFLFISLIGFSQRWQDSNRGLYPQSIQVTYNVKNTAIGLRYGYLFNKPVMEMPLGWYASFSNTINPYYMNNVGGNNYDWERKYSLGGMVQLPYSRKMNGTHTFLTVGVVYNSHKDPYLDYPGRYDANLYYTSNVGCDIGIEQQRGRVKWHLTVDALNFMRYVEFGCGYTFFR